MAMKMLLIFSLFYSILPFLLIVSAVDIEYQAIFNFGDSNSDTGGLIAGLGGHLYPPNGQTYFHKPSGRFSDGRLIIDFLMRAMNLPFLNSYLDSVGAPEFRRGCNFAVAGSTILPSTAVSISPFSFGIQVAQFFRFKARVLELLGNNAMVKPLVNLPNQVRFTVKANEFGGVISYMRLDRRRLLLFYSTGGKTNKFLPQEEYFKLGLYMFDIGQNDLAGAFYSKSEDQVLASIPTILLEFEAGVRKLYDQGARRFWIHNTGPLGCLPQNIAKFGENPSKLDELGCVSSHNRASKVFNLHLYALCRKLQGEFIDANITYVDVFSIKFGLIANFSRNGFKHPTTACCGYGGPPLNYDARIFCGQTKNLNGSSVTAEGCDNANEYINWDGIHYTEAANFYVSQQILTGNYSNPPFSTKMPFLPKLKF